MERVLNLIRATAEHLLLFSCLPLSIAVAGTNGILEGVVKDKQTGEPLPSVNIALSDLQRGSTTDANGHYAIQNIRAGKYEIKVSLIGYKTHVIRNVTINPDLKTTLDVQLEAAEVELEEITVVQEKPLIQKDVTGTTFIVSGEEVKSLPIDKVSDIVALQAGVTPEGNVRGGKSTEVTYLIDGLPVQDAIAGGLGASLPNSSVVGISIYTGGFEAEYGNALSGVVNIVTETGSNEHRLLLRADSDNLFGGTQTSRTREFELSASGPIVQEKLFYVAAGNGFFTDTRWWQDFQNFFGSPIEKNLSGLGKLDYHFTPTLHLGTQILYSRHEWRDYEFSWRYNLAGLPPEDRTSNRIAAILSHTISEGLFYTLSLSRFWHRSKIGGEDVPVDDPYQYDFFLRYIIDGQRAWWSNTTQENYTARFDASYKTGAVHLLKFGGELNLYDLNSDLIKYEPRKTYFGKPLVDEPQLDFSTTYRYQPRLGALYIQDKIDVETQGILINLGFRYDVLDPRASRPAIEAIPVSDSSYLFVPESLVTASPKHQLSPRLGASMQLTERGYLFVNLGWYFQFPLFDYLYTGLDRVTLAKGLAALTGNPNLEPERTKSYEISLRYILSENVVGAITYFKKETTNQVDSKTFVPGDSKVSGTFGFAEFVNNPYAQVEGLEIVLSRERGTWITGELSYTVMRTEGLSGSASDGFFIAQYGLPPAIRLYPLSWDQTHTVKLVSAVVTPWDMNVNLVVQWHSGRPYTNYPTATGFEPIDGGLFQPNNARLSSFTNVDLKVSQHFRLGLGDNSILTFYLDVRNLFNNQNVSWVDSNGRIGGELEIRPDILLEEGQALAYKWNCKRTGSKGEYSQYHVMFLSVALLAGCEESLPPRNDPQNFLDVTFQGEDGTVELRDAGTLLSTTPGGFSVSVKNLYDEVLQDEEDINIDIDFWLAGNENISGTAHGDRSALLFSHMIQNGNLLTIEPQEIALFHLQWDHAAEQLWKYTDLTFEVEHGSNSDTYWFQSGPISLAAKGTARLFKTTGVLALVEDQFTINYKLYVDAPVIVQVNNLTARYDAHINAVILEWETPLEVNTFGFRVEKGMNQSPFESASLDLIPGQGSTPDTTGYSFTDSLGLSQGTWDYRLEKWYDWGFIQWPVGYSDTVSVQIP